MCFLCAMCAYTLERPWRTILPMSELQKQLATHPPLTETVIGYLLRSDSVLLGVRKRVSDNLGHLLIAGIGGRLEPGETSELALQREIEEEIKVRIKAWRLVGRSVNLSPHKPSHNLGVDIYVVSEYDGEPQETDDIAPLWVPKTELPLDRMWPDNRLTAPLVLQGERIMGTFLYGPDGDLIEHDLHTLGPHETTADI